MTPDGLRRTLDKMLDELDQRGMGLREVTGTHGTGEVIIVLVVRGDEYGEQEPPLLQLSGM